MSIRDNYNDIRATISTVDQIKIALLCCLTILLFAPSILRLTHTWNTSDDYSHGYFVIPIALYMVWQKKEKILSTPINPSWMGLPIFLFGLVAYIVAFAVSFHTLVFLSMIVVLIGVLILMTGWRLTKVLLLPVLFLLFMFPIPSSYYILLTNPLKLMITSISANLIELVGITVYQDGNLLFFANTQLEVAEACSGIRSLYSYLMLGCLFALFCRNTTHKWVIILSPIPLAILVNIVRVSGTGILSNYYGEKVAQGFFHEFAGFVLFAVGFASLLGIYYLLEGRTLNNQPD